MRWRLSRAARQWFDVTIALWSKPLVVAGSILLIFSSLARYTALAQESFSSTAHDSALPDAPQPTQVTTPSGANDSQQTGTGSLSGTVLDTNRNVLQGARVTIADPPGSVIRTVESGSNGQFAFTGLPPDVYKLTVTARGMSTFTSTQIPLHAGESRIMPPVTLSVSGGTTSVTVTGNTEELAEEQVKIAVQQRIGGVIPNFYSTYDWNAPPMRAKQKFQLSIRSIIDPVSFLTVAGIAGAEQYKDVFPAYGGGIEGYGKRYGAALANHVSGTLLGRAVYPSIFHQDPRYFYKGKGSIGSRALYAISAAVIARGDDGRWKPNYSRVLGNFSAAAISNLYYPASDRGGSLVVFNGLAGTGADAVGNLIREFLLKRITSHVPKGANGQP
jgi:carboxypeptidase family protein